jgi:glycine betaine/choline ABC-type transport system substrate-binding protein
MKKTEYITYRTDAKIRSILKKLSDEKKWSLSQISEEIIREWLQEKHPELMQDEQQ